MSGSNLTSPPYPETIGGYENDPLTQSSSRLISRSRSSSSDLEQITDEQWLSLFHSNNDSRTTFDRASALAPSFSRPADVIHELSTEYNEEPTVRQRLLFRPDIESMEDAAHSIRIRAGTSKRTRDNFESSDGRLVVNVLSSSGSAIALMLYQSEPPDPGANDVWPRFRNVAKQPIRYYTLKRNVMAPLVAKKSRPTSSQESIRPDKIPKHNELGDAEMADEDDIPAPGWPPSQLPTELFEEIASYLNRDDIKSMRLVCREFDRHVSQVLFSTVVVPFNTEIYGMLGQDQKPDFKGKKKVRIETKGLTWKNANGDDVYNGHGLDVFRGFGKHIRKFGMSFEVNEDSLAKPPEKSLAEKHQSFWGSYDWPFEEYRRFDDVAGLEFAADETPRMKIAFSELTKVQELALSIDSGLGWLNGPDRSIRAKILPRSPEVFGRLKKSPDRRTQAQKELWGHIEACHQAAGSDIKQATLYKLEANRQLSELHDADATLQQQPEMPFLDPHIIHEAIPHDTADFSIPASFDDPEVLDRFVVAPSSSGTGVLFSSAVLPTDAGQLMSPIIPANLTKAQKEWLLETEWAQRAFISSYMLAVIDNPLTFCNVHTLNISQLSDRYIGMLSRHDFWNSLPNLNNVVLQVIPGWRAVHKDEAGFVETPKISPSSCIDSFYDLLRNNISQRSNVKKLTAGWVTGGEHAEGVHARNKLILPVPFLTAARAFEQDFTSPDQNLLEFPHVEELTLKNCWITPAALLEFVKQHDNFSLKTLILNSVSLTAVLRNPANNANNQNHAQQANVQVANALPPAIAAVFHLQVNNPNAGGVVQQPMQANNVNPQQLLQFHIQALQVHIQQLQTQQQGQLANPQLAALQAQLQNQIQLQAQFQIQNPNQTQNPPQAQNHVHGQNVQAQQPALNMANLFGNQHVWAWQHHANPLAAQPPPPAPVVPAPNPQAVLRAQPRAGSWTYILDIMSPGLNLSDFGSEFSSHDPVRATALENIHLKSVGYVRLPYAQFDQADIEPLNPIPRNQLIEKKRGALGPAMLSAKWPLLGEIIQEIPLSELTALNAGWDLVTGWENQEEARAVEFDGLMPGGTGRLSGKVRRGDRIMGASSS
jgi:hypothetical protein